MNTLKIIILTLFLFQLPYLSGQTDRNDESDNCYPKHYEMYMAWKRFYFQNIYKDYAAEFFIDETIPAHTKALILHGIGLNDFWFHNQNNETIEKITALEDIECLSIKACSENQNFNYNSYKGSYGEAYEKNLIRLIPWIKSLKNLKALYISYPNTEFLQALFECQNLEVVYIGGTDAFDLKVPQEFIEKTLRVFPKLKFLLLVNSNIKTFPDEFSNLNLETLYFVNNEKIPNFVYDIKTLKSLRLTIGTESKLSPSIAKLPNLQRLSLVFKDSISTKLPEEMTQMKNLRWLWLTNHSMNSIDLAPISRMNLRTLCLYNYDKKLTFNAEVKSLRNLYMNAPNVSLDMSKLVNLQNLVITSKDTVKFTGKPKYSKRFNHFQISSRDYNKILIVENWIALFDKIKSFNTLSLLWWYNPINLIKQNPFPTVIDAKNVLVSAYLMNTNNMTFKNKGLNLNVIGIASDYCESDFYLECFSDCQLERYSREYKNIKYAQLESFFIGKVTLKYKNVFPFFFEKENALENIITHYRPFFDLK